MTLCQHLGQCCDSGDMGPNSDLLHVLIGPDQCSNFLAQAFNSGANCKKYWARKWNPDSY
jgi:hypothetical protein